MKRKSVAAVAMAGSLLVGAGAGLALFGPLAAGAQTSTTTPGSSTAGPGKSFKSNEDPAHEAKETPEQEAAEDSGQFHGGGHFRGGHGSNEDPAHEATESPEREAAENAAKAAGGQSSGSAPSNAPAAKGSL